MERDERAVEVPRFVSPRQRMGSSKSDMSLHRSNLVWYVPARYASWTHCSCKSVGQIFQIGSYPILLPRKERGLDIVLILWPRTCWRKKDPECGRMSPMMYYGEQEFWDELTDLCIEYLPLKGLWGSRVKHCSLWLGLCATQLAGECFQTSIYLIVSNSRAFQEANHIFGP